MEFYEKLQELRKRKGLTQEELADALFVSRTAVSKWESGRGYPNIDSLKAISKFFGVTVDELLSGDELLTLAEENNKQKEGVLRDLVFGLLDVSILLLLFLPCFAQDVNGAVQSVALLSLTNVSLYLRIIYFDFVSSSVLAGILILAFQNCQKRLWVTSKHIISLILSAFGLIIFIISMQPYAASLLFVFLAIKVLMLKKLQ
jgi:transcriptional regulator with XRE-family HTH domain